MAVNQINFYSNSDVSIIDLMNTADASFIGTHQVSLTNYDNTSLPAIAIGSIVENNGALFKFEDETAISGAAVDGTNYILLVPSGDPSLGTATVTPTWSQTAPTWSDSKQGWYGTGGSANYRYLEFIIYKATASYSPKEVFNRNSKNRNDLFKTYILCQLSGSDQTITTVEVVKFASKSYDYNNSFDVSTYKFTAPKNGVFSFNVTLGISGLSSANPTIFYPKKNGTEIAYQRTYFEGAPSTPSGLVANVTEKLNAGDEITFFISNTGDASFNIYHLHSKLTIHEI